MKIINSHQPKKHSEQGFALLMTLIVVTVVISIGLSVLDLSIKQVRLSTNTRDSEIAFHAANAGMECARFVRRNRSAAMESGTDISPSCFLDGSLYQNTKEEIITGLTGDGDVYKYEYAFTWGGAAPRCSQITTLVAVSSFSGETTITDMPNEVPGYPGPTKTCAAGERCTVISVRGYNKSCAAVTSNSYGIVQREVLLQF